VPAAIYDAKPFSILWMLSSGEVPLPQKSVIFFQAVRHISGAKLSVLKDESIGFVEQFH